MSERKTTRSKKNKKEKGKGKSRQGVLKLLTIGAFFLTVFGMIVAMAFAIYVNKKIEKNIDESLFMMIGSDSATTLYYYDESEITGEVEAVELSSGALYGGYRCKYVDYEQLPEDLIHAFISIEDKRFYSHKGVDWKRTLSAGLNYFLKFRDSYGGSTITQQLIKNVTDEDDYTFQRKIQEIFWALDLETKMDKKEILSLYLNIINLSQGCYGVQAASEYYFSKDVSQLTLNECACIAAITNSPSYYDPIRNPEHNKERRNLILRQMYEQGYIDHDTMERNIENDIVLSINEEYRNTEINSWYVDMVIEDVLDDLIENKGYSRAMANLVLYTGGIRIYTAMDPEIQEIMESYYKKEGNFYSAQGEETPQSSMIVIDPENGDILGVVGAIGEKKANRIQNFATQTLRPPGSVIKPLSVYAPALEQDLITWSSVYDDVPVNFGSYNPDMSKGKPVEPVAWPKNSNGIYRGLTNINYAIEHSINTVTVRALEDLGLETSFEFLYNRLHMESLIASGYTADGMYITDMDVAALALGQLNYGVSVKEITAAYSIFANQGIYNAPRSYYKVTDPLGSIILENQYHGEAVLSEDNASIMTMMLENVIKNGTANTIALQSKVDCAGKTGTTQNNYDRWFIGYTPYFIGGVWYGYEYPKALAGTNLCIDIWEDIMERIHERQVFSVKSGNNGGKSVEKFAVGNNVMEYEYCADSGKLVTQACLHDPRGARTEKGYFVRGTEPVEYCDCHVPVAYDTAEGGVAFEDECPKENVTYVGLIHVRRSFPTEVYVTDAQYVWRELGGEILPETSPGLPFFNNILKENEYCGISRGETQYNRFCQAHFNYFVWKDKQKE